MHCYNCGADNNPYSDHNKEILEDFYEEIK